MKSIPFNAETDKAPIPFNPVIVKAAQRLKELGLPWTPHVGCFVWDAENRIDVASPFPENIYFILSMPRFLSILGNVETMQQELVWLPTWHQARLLMDQLGIGTEALGAIFPGDSAVTPDDEMLAVYSILARALEEKTR
jgi:hypothetical protein